MQNRIRALVIISALLIQGCAATIIAGGAGVAAVAVDQRTTGTVVEDQAIEFRIANGLHGDAELLAQANVSATSYNHVVLLTGESPSEILKERVYNIAAKDSKVKKIYNRIEIRNPLPLRARNFDIWLSTKVKTKLFSIKKLEALKIKVISSNTTVYLMGLVSRELADIAADTTSRIDGVHKVIRAFEYVD